jgi:hypothetical protein
VAIAALLGASALYAGNHDSEGGPGNSGNAGAQGAEASAKGRAISDAAKSGENRGTALAKVLCGIIGNDNCETIGGEDEASS